MDAEIDDIEELKRWIAVGLQNATKADAERLKLYINLMLVGAEQFTGILQSKCAALAQQCRPRNAKPPKPAPQSGPKKQNDTQRSDDREAPSLEAVLPEFLDFLDGAVLVQSELDFALSFLKDAIEG